MIESITFVEWLAQKLGTTKWVVNFRLTDRLRGKGYELALSQKRYSALATEFQTIFGREAW